MERSSLPPELLEKYLNGTASPSEKEAVETWYAALRGQPDYLSTLSESERQALQVDTHQTIRARLGLTDDQPKIIPLRPWYSQLWPFASGVAAAVLLIALTWVMVGRTELFTKQPASVATKNVLIQVRNRQARIVSQHLPDSTVVWLHPGAELRYPSVFRGDRREVRFAGEAFFDVAKDPRKPFLIQSGTMQIRVVGTSFNVRAAPRQAVFEVAVVTGKVVVQSLKRSPFAPAESVELLPKQQALYDVTANRLTRQPLPDQARKDFYEPVSIAFTDAPVRDVLRRLESRFDVRFRVTNPAVNACRLTADFAEQPLPVILELLCTSLDATYTMSVSDNTIVINSEGCR